MTYDYLIEIINGILLGVLLLWVFLDNMRAFKKQQLMRCIFLTLLVVVAETGCLLTDNTVPENRGWSLLFNCIGFGVAPLVLLLESDLYNMEHEKLHLWRYIPAAVNGICVLLSPLYGCIFQVTEKNEYRRGPLFEVYLVAFLFSIVCSAVKKLLCVRNLPAMLSVKIAASNVLFLGTVCQVLYPQFHITWLTMSIYLLLVYSLLKEMDGLLDQMTGLLNRNTFQLMIAQQQHKKSSVRKNKGQAVVVFDVDRFKQINDTLGHLKGDEYICRVAKMLKQTFGSYHRVFRVGGDEFAAILSGVSESDVCRYLEKVDQAVRKNRLKDEVFPTVSYGYAFGSMEQAVRMADERMYDCKKCKKQSDAVDEDAVLQALDQML